jgi:hypothetical protein
MRIGRGGVSALVLLGLASALAWRSLVDVDVGLHLAGGRWIAEHGRVPGADPFTWTLGDRAYVAYHWAFQLALHAIEGAAGATGLAVFRFALVLGTALLLLDGLRLRRVGSLAAAVTALLAIFATEWRFTLRPELVSWLLAAALLAVLERHRSRGWAPLWLLPVIQCVWANTHVHVLGLALIAIYTLDDCVRRRRVRTPLVAWGAVSVAAVFVNPYGAEGAFYPLVLATRLTSGNLFAQHITELASPLAIAPDAGGSFGSGVQLSAYRTLFLMAAVALVVHLRRGRLVDAALLAIFGGLSLLAVRNVGIFTVVSVPAIAAALDGWLTSPDAAPHPARRRLADALLGLALASAFLTIPRVVSGSYYALDRRPDRFEARWCRDCLALETADWVAASDLMGRGLNDLRMGSVLVWRDPGRGVFIDGRNEVTGEAFYARYLGALDPDHWTETQAEFGFDYVTLFHRGDARAVALARRLLDEPDWRMVHLDGAGVVFVRVSGPNAHWPAARLPHPVGPEERRRRLSEIHVEASAGDQLRRWLWSTRPPPGAAQGLGNFLARVGESAAAERPLLEASEANPDFFEPHLDLGLVYRELGLRRAALQAFRRAKALAPDHPGLAPIAMDGD